MAERRLARHRQLAAIEKQRLDRFGIAVGLRGVTPELAIPLNQRRGLKAEPRPVAGFGERAQVLGTQTIRQIAAAFALQNFCDTAAVIGVKTQSQQPVIHPGLERMAL